MKIIAAILALAAIISAVLLAIPGNAGNELLAIVICVVGFGLCRLVSWVLSKS